MCLLPTYLPTYLSVNISIGPPVNSAAVFPLSLCFCLFFSVYLVISSYHVIIRVRKCLPFWYHSQQYGGSMGDCVKAPVHELARISV